MEIIIFIIWLLFALIGYKMAENRGRNKWLGAFLGFIGGIFTIIGYAIVGKTKQKKAEELKELKDILKD